MKYFHLSTLELKVLFKNVGVCAFFKFVLPIWGQMFLALRQGRLETVSERFEHLIRSEFKKKCVLQY